MAIAPLFGLTFLGVEPVAVEHLIDGRRIERTVALEQRPLYGGGQFVGRTPASAPT